MRFAPPAPKTCDIWKIYSLNFGPDGLRREHRRYISQRPTTAPSSCSTAMSSPECRAFIGIDQNRQCLEIGGTYYRPHLRGSGFNRRVKDMMLKRAFDCGIRRVEFRVDRRNERSQAAMKKLGAVREGVLRADRITWTGHVRDTVLFAILKRGMAAYEACRSRFPAVSLPLRAAQCRAAAYRPHRRKLGLHGQERRTRRRTTRSNLPQSPGKARSWSP